MDMAMPIAMETDGIRQAVEQRFPGLQAYRRPGFDDDQPQVGS